MQRNDQILFDLLKQKIVETMRQTYPGINPSISEWRGQEITDFQEELRTRVNANLSEKWFYTHMKGNSATLPRVDMLNILSRYVGYANWDEFVFASGEKILVPSHVKAEAEEHTAAPVKPRSANRYFLLVPALAVALAAALFGIYSLFSTREYRFRFVDADTREAIVSPLTEVTLLVPGESPVTRTADSAGLFRLKTSLGKVRMVVRSPYYRPDTVVRTLRKFENAETVALHADEYAMALHFLSAGSAGDWEKRRSRLTELIAPDAMICRVVKGSGPAGAVLYTRDEFVDLLTLPSGTLRSFELLGTTEKEGKIVMLKFRTR